MSWLLTILNWIIENFWLLVIAILLGTKFKVLWDKLFWEPITGGNGKTVMSELAQYVLIILLCIMVAIEAADGEQYTEGVFLAIAGSVAFIAGVKVASNAYQNKGQ